jgi:hypothetical protein
MTILRIGKDGIPRDFFSGKIVDVENFKPNLPKMEKRQFEASAAQHFEATPKAAARAIARANQGIL